MRNQEECTILKIFRTIIFFTFVQGLVACGGDGLFSGEKSFANKNLGAIQVTEADEIVLGLDSLDIDSGEEVTSVDGDGYADDELMEDGFGIKGESENGEVFVSTDCPGKSNCNGKKHQTPEDPRENSSVERTDSAENLDGIHYICILSGPGKSIRLGLVDDSPAGQVGTPGVICMSKSACLVDVSKAFDVKVAHSRGFCRGKNPHVVRMADEEIAVMIKKLED